MVGQLIVDAWWYEQWSVGSSWDDAWFGRARRDGWGKDGWQAMVGCDGGWISWINKPDNQQQSKSP